MRSRLISQITARVIAGREEEAGLAPEPGQAPLPAAAAEGVATSRAVMTTGHAGANRRTMDRGMRSIPHAHPLLAAELL